MIFNKTCKIVPLRGDRSINQNSSYISELIFVSVPLRGDRSINGLLPGTLLKCGVSVPLRGDRSINYEEFFDQQLNFLVSVPLRGDRSINTADPREKDFRERFPSPYGVIGL